MTGAAKLNYSQIRNLVFQMPEEDRALLYAELSETQWNHQANEPEMPFFGPRNHEEAVARLRESIDDMEKGNLGDIDDLIARLKKKYPWADK